MKKIEVNFIINKKPVTVEAYPNERLLDVLRDTLKLTGRKAAPLENAGPVRSSWTGRQ